MKSLRIQMVSDRYLPVVGGAERQAHQLAIELQERGHRVSILTRRLSLDLPRTELIDNIPITRLEPIGLSKIANARIILSIIRYLLSNKNEFDIIHAHTLGPVGLATILAAKMLNKPVVLKAPTYGDISRQNTTNQALTLYTRLVRNVVLPQPLWNSILRQANAIIAISQEIADEAHQAGIDNIVEIPNGVNTTQFRPLSAESKQLLREKLGLLSETFYLFYSGRFVRRKRVDVVLQALPDILEQYPDSHLLLAGSGTLQADSTEAELRAMVDALMLKNQVTFLGLIDNVAEYLQAVDCFVFPSVTEGMPNAVLEAMASGVPVVASRINGVIDMLNNESGWLFQAGDWQSFKVALLDLLKLPEEKSARTQNALYKVQTEFSLEMVAEKYENLYRRLL